MVFQVGNIYYYVPCSVLNRSFLTSTELCIPRRREQCLTSEHLSQQRLVLLQTKNAEKDEKRHLSKLTLVADVASHAESRDLTARFDLDPGCYFLVPYTMEAGDEGRFLVSLLGEKERVSCKTGWSVFTYFTYPYWTVRLYLDDAPR